MGNQLFKSLGAIQASHNNLRSVCFDVTWYQNKTFANGVTASRRFELAGFPTLSQVPLVAKNSFQTKIESRLVDAHPAFMERIGYQLSPISMNNKFKLTKVYKCDFEDYSALPNRNLLLDYLKFAKISSLWSQEIKKIALKENAIAVHVRRNDYLTFSNIYPKLGISYYLSSLNYMRSKLGDLPIWLFSDNPEGVIREFANSIKFDRVISPPPEVPMAEILELFSLMKGVVTANSTFSWWGAYIGAIHGNVEQVTMPEKFTTLDADPGLKLRTPGWKIIPN